jgi:predicted nucleotidyltransferase
MDLVESLKARLAEVCDLDFAFLYGSRAHGDARGDSDVDVAVYFAPTVSERDLFRRRLEIAADLESLGDPDVVVLNQAPPLLAHRALMGRPIVINDRTSYVRFFVRTLAASGDERYWRGIAERERRSRLEEGRFGRP